MARKPHTIGVVGEALVDLVVASDGSVTAHLGGAPFNAARAAGRLGAPVAFFGTFSVDRFGQALASQLMADGVDVSGADRVEQPTTLAVAELDDDGSASYRFYTAGTSAPLFRSATVDRSALRHVLTGGLALVLQPMADEVERLVDSLDATTVLMLDVNCRPSVVDDRSAYADRVGRVAARAHVVKASTDDLRYLHADVEPMAAARNMVDGGVGVVVVTDGGSEVTILTADGGRTIQVPDVDVIDTVGAGDTFCGAFLASTHLRGVDLAVEPNDLDVLADIARDAVGAAAEACRRAGADPPWAADLPTWPTN